jgi:hypothetical protein
MVPSTTHGAFYGVNIVVRDEHVCWRYRIQQPGRILPLEPARKGSDEPITSVSPCAEIPTPL